MPELPEVDRTSKFVHDTISGSTLVDITIRSGRYSRHGFPIGYDGFIQNLPMRVEESTFSGKLIIIRLVDQTGKKWWIWNTLGMSGSWRINEGKHSHIKFKTTAGDIYFDDPRNFGTMKFTDSEKETLSKMNTIGPNHLQHEIPDETFKIRLGKRPNLTLAEALMNQSLIGGVGNYIKAEALYRAKLSPHRTVSSLSDDDFSNLNSSCREVIIGSFRGGGASFSTYNVDEKKGDFQFSFMVYGKQKCPQGFDVIRETTEDGRTTHWVPEIQK